jgi:hypothetical protein
MAEIRLRKRGCAHRCQCCFLTAFFRNAAIRIRRAVPACTAFARQARCAGSKRTVLGGNLAQLRRGFGVVEANEQLALAYALARTDQNILDRGWLGCLHQLHLARRDHPPLTTGHFVNLRKTRPDQKKQETCGRGNDDLA